MAAQKNRKGLRVIIVGGSISGLTLANALEKAGIDFVVLEQQKDITVQNGASIIVFPNGFITLDQLGLSEDIQKLTEPMTEQNSRSGPDARLIRRFDGFRLMWKRSGYPARIFPRLTLVRLLYAKLSERARNDKVFTNHRVSKIEYTSKGVSVDCENNASFSGDLVIGADGIHSIVRNEMWRHAELAEPAAFDIKDKTSICAEFNIVFGFSKIPGGSSLPEHEDHRIHGKDYGLLVLHTENGTVYWFIFTKLDKKYTTPNIPKYTKADAQKVAERFLDHPITENVKFGLLWEHRQIFSLHPIEEYVANRWTWNRFAAIGDAVHKFGPNNGQGGCTAIEDAAVLANHIKKLSDLGEDLDTTIIANNLRSFQELRLPRIRPMDTESRMILRGDCLQGAVANFAAHYAIPNIPDFIENSWAENMVSPAYLDYLPIPRTAKVGTLPLNAKLGLGKRESLLIRILRATPLLLMFVAFYYISGPKNKEATQIISGGLRDPGVGELLTKSYAAMIQNPISLRQLLVLWTDFLPVYGVWIIESHRRGNVLTFSQLPILFAIGLKTAGCGIVALYAFLHYIQNSPSSFMAADQRYVRKTYARTLLPALFIGYIIPTLFMTLYAPRLQSFETIIAAWQFFPIVVPVLHYILAKAFPDTAAQDRINDPWADLPYLRMFYIVSAALCAICHWYVNLAGPVSFPGLTLRGLKSFRTPSESLANVWSILLALDYIAMSSSMAILVIMHFRDLKAIDRMDLSWIRILMAYGVVTIVAGPGAAFVAAWAYREEILATKPELDVALHKGENIQ